MKLLKMNYQCDVLFVVPSTMPDICCESIGTLILAKTAQLNGYDVRIIRYWEVEQNITSYETFAQKIVRRILRSAPKVLAFYCRCAEYHICIDVASRIKSGNKDITIVFGGPQAELVAVQTLETFPFVDFICCGEGETTIVPFLDVICNKKPQLSLNEIPGLVYRRDNKEIGKNNLPELLQDGYERSFQYYDLVPDTVIHNSGVFPIDVGRGCPFACVFCSTKTFWKQKYRLRNTEDIIKEIEYVTRTFNVNKFTFEHDLFTVNKKRIIDFCHQLEKHNLSISWGCSSRIDTIDKELIDTMWSVGLRHIYYGIETGSQELQKKIKKNININKCKEIVQYSVEKGIKVTTSLIYGFPEETKETFEDTLSLIYDFREMGVWYVQTHLLSIMNGTDYYNTYHNRLMITDNISNQNILLGVSELKSLISRHPNIFPSFYDLVNDIRYELRFFYIFDRVWDFFPYTLNHIIRNFEFKGYSKYDVYMFFNKTCRDTFYAIEYTNSLQMSEQWCRDILEYFIKKLPFNTVCVKKITNQLTNEYNSYHKS